MAGEKKAIRINFVDVLLTVVLACILAIGVFMIANAFGVDASSDKEQLTIEYTIQFRGLQSEFGDNVEVGETVIDAQKRLNLGNVLSATVEPFTKDVYNEETGMMETATHPEYITLYIRVSSPGYMADEMYYVNGIKMAVGNGISIHTKNFCATGYVSDMRIK